MPFKNCRTRKSKENDLTFFKVKKWHSKMQHQKSFYNALNAQIVLQISQR